MIKVKAEARDEKNIYNPLAPFFKGEFRECQSHRSTFLMEMQRRRPP